ncbi:MAG: RNA 2',3'-cyclic phosphodiesterase [Bacteroidota bacterium]|nr:RNA 2',3'-cyclic phosphodiesterase [Bacteroidota bacterium]
MKRTFIAIEIDSSEKLLSLFSRVKEELSGEKINWVDEHNLHITLNFLGEISSEMEEKVCGVLKELTLKKQTFEFKLKGIGVFPGIRNPRVLWTGAEDTESLCNLQQDIAKSLLELNLLSDEKPFKAHLTLGRIKKLVKLGNVEKLVEGYKETFIQKVVVDKIIFFESVLTSRGAIYNPIEVFELNK